jgi:hypothetical protein|tara:strand:- start:481 stop:693 length:213 start_codon:yes stop_codon:yes gene_type:complete
MQQINAGTVLSGLAVVAITWVGSQVTGNGVAIAELRVSVDRVMDVTDTHETRIAALESAVAVSQAIHADE